jgi:hypothetical protein
MEKFGYVPPPVPEGVQPVDLMASSVAGPVREPADNERVLCVNRGRNVIVDTFDARHVEIPAGHFYIEYGAAKHFQRRNIVPGTKNITGGQYVSWLGIVGVNDEAACRMFTDEELIAFGERVEAIERGSDHGFGADVKIVPTNAVRASSPTLGMGALGGNGRGAVGIDATQQASSHAEAAATAVLEKPAESETRAAEAEARGERGGRRGR